MVHPIALYPKKINPKTIRIIFTNHIKEPTFHSGNKVARIIDIPLVPPKAKWFGVLKMAIPMAVQNKPKFKVRKNQIL